MSRWHRFLCNFLGWHTSPILGNDGASFTGRCSRCRQPVLMDSNGDWFETGEETEAERG
jgi:hypothetical protein